MDDPVAWAQAQPADAMRARVLLALAQRAAAQPPGALRDRLIAKLQQRAAAPPAPLPERRAASTRSPLAALLAQLQAAGPELRQVQAHQRTWSQLRVARRMAEVSAPVPEHLGPLNNQVLVTRALQQLQALAPDYLQRLLTQLDALAALAPLQVAAEADKPARPAGRKTASRKR
ncbi:DUF2894 domain-containing protein [Roseateles asaccharophilus]|uniref:DUF2894 domain-containing protein n=1 Tax=Roseateles asaccharophilus TaxID=582607 RepID=A0ABU2ADF5_9BURK|nr:hypothetical protein [Roseateles asaccharophilus]